MSERSSYNQENCYAKKPYGKRSAKTIAFRVTAQQKRKLQLEADKEEVSLSSFVRRRVLQGLQGLSIDD